MSEKIVIPKALRDDFERGFQGVTGWHERIIFANNAGTVNLDSYRRTGIVPEEWIEHLNSFDSGITFLDRWKEVVKEHENGKPVRIKLVTHRNKKVVPKDKNHIVLENMAKAACAETDKELAEIIGKQASAISAMRHKRLFIYEDVLEILADFAGVSVLDLLIDECGEESPDKKTDGEAIAEKQLFKLEYIEEINKVVQSACYFTGALADSTLELDKEKFFFGYLLCNLQDYSLQFSEYRDEVIFKKEDFEYSLSFSHLLFD